MLIKEEREELGSAVWEDAAVVASRARDNYLAVHRSGTLRDSREALQGYQEALQELLDVITIEVGR